MAQFYHRIFFWQDPKCNFGEIDGKLPVYDVIRNTGKDFNERTVSAVFFEFSAPYPAALSSHRLYMFEIP